jgi:Protein of unknown function (DUF3800)
MLTAYFDASGTPNTGVLTVAGYVSDTKKWLKFTNRWQEILDRDGVTIFHMTDCVSCRGEFSTWRKKLDTRRQFIDDLSDCARKFTNKRFSATVVIDDYNRVDRDYYLHENIGYPYSLGAISCVEHVRTWAKRNRFDPADVSFVFEDGDKHKGDFREICKARFGVVPEFHSKKDFLQFQAADLAAWKTRHPIREALGNKPYTQAEVDTLLFHTKKYLREPHAGGGFDYVALMKICTGASIPGRLRPAR